jgi:uncharacterized protein (TIGR02271 family)
LIGCITQARGIKKVRTISYKYQIKNYEEKLLMALYKIADIYPEYKEDVFAGEDIKSYSIYDLNNDKVGSVYDILVDETGHFRYLIIDTGFWIFGKKVLLPVGQAKIDYNQQRIYALNLTREQAETLPEYDDEMTVDYGYEEEVRKVYRGVEYQPSRYSNSGNYSDNSGNYGDYDSSNYSYDRDPQLYQLDRATHGDVYDYERNFMNNSDRFKFNSEANLYKISDVDPNYHSIFDNNDLMSYSLYSDTDEKVGSIKDILVDREGHFRYLVIDTGFWILGKKVLLPFGRARIDSVQKRVYATGLTKEQVEHLPEYDSDMTVDYDYEDRVRRVYRGVEYTPTSSVNATETGTGSNAAYAGAYNSNYDYNEDSFEYDREPNLYAHRETEGEDSQNLKLYEERLIANKERFRAGSVTIGKRVETETATVSVPVEKERVVIERSQPTNYTAVTPGEAAFKEGEVARMEVYEESADIQKQAFVREEVSVRKEVEQDVVSAKETIRREELDIKNEGDTVVDGNV